MDDVARLVAEESIDGLAKLALYLRSIDPWRDPRGMNARSVREAAIEGLLEIGRRNADPRVARALLAMPGGYGEHALARLLDVSLSDSGYALPAKEREARLRPFVIDDETIRQRLLDVAQYRLMENVRANLKAVDRHGAEEYAEQLRGRRDIHGLTGALARGNSELRVAAAASLGRVGGSAAVETLRKTAASDKSPEVRRQAVMALRDLGEVAEAADAAAARRTRATVHAMRKLIQERVESSWSESAHEERVARQQVTSIGTEAIALVLDMLRSAAGDAWQVEALHALGELGDERAVDDVIAVLRRSGEILQGQWHPATVDPYSDYYAWARRKFEQAELALGQIGGPKATQILNDLRVHRDAAARSRRGREMRSAGRRPPLTGRQVMEILGIPAGPLVGEALEFLIDAFPDEREAEPQTVRARLVAWADERGIRRGG